MFFMRMVLMSAAKALFREKIRRTKLLDFLAEKPRCVITLEACGGAHHSGRQLTQIAVRCGLFLRPM